MSPFPPSEPGLNDIASLLDILHRGLNDENILVRVSIDGGGGFLKNFLSLFDLNSLASNTEKGFAKKFKDSGVKKVNSWNYTCS